VFFDALLNGIAGFANAPVDIDGFIRQVPLTLRGSAVKYRPQKPQLTLYRHVDHNDS